MPNNQDNLKQLQKLSQIFNVDKIVSPADIEAVLSGILKIMNSFKSDNEKLTTETKNSVNTLYNKILAEQAKLKDDLNGNGQKSKDEVFAKLEKSVKEMKFAFSELILKKPQDGKNADEEIIVDKVMEKIVLPEYKETVLDDAGQIADKLESLKGDKRLDASAIKNLPEATEGGRSGWISSVKEAPTDGLTYGRKDMEWVVISTAGSGMTKLPATGTVDNSNKTFTFTEEPTVIVINGATYRKGAGWSWSVLTATLDNAVGSGGDIYGLS